ncbi:uncharacterized protein KNAG_0F04040, partial [Huiozyma naganishii CBS 8797]
MSNYSTSDDEFYSSASQDSMQNSNAEILTQDDVDSYNALSQLILSQQAGPEPSVTKISDRCFVIDGYIVFINANGTKTLRIKMFSVSFLHKFEQEALCQLETVNIEALYNLHTCSRFIPCTSSKLFEFMETNSVYVMETAHGLQLATREQKPMARKLDVIRFRPQLQMFKYLYYAPARKPIRIGTSQEFVPITNTREVGFYRKKLCLQNLEFSASDRTLLADYLTNDSEKRSRVLSVLLKYYNTVCARVAKTAFTTDRNGHQ